MMISKKSKQSEYKICKRNDCENLLINHINKFYCSSPECQAIRKKENAPKKTIIEDLNNIRITKKQELIGKILTLNCEFPDCEIKITIPYTLNRTVYPKYCNTHCSPYRRKRLLYVRDNCNRQQSE